MQYCRDYVKLGQDPHVLVRHWWSRLTQLDLDHASARALFGAKLAAKGITDRGTEVLFPPDLPVVLADYWERELGRLVRPVPDMREVLTALRDGLHWLGGSPGPLHRNCCHEMLSTPARRATPVFRLIETGRGSSRRAMVQTTTVGEGAAVAD